MVASVKSSLAQAFLNTQRPPSVGVTSTPKRKAFRTEDLFVSVDESSCSFNGSRYYIGRYRSFAFEVTGLLSSSLSGGHDDSHMLALDSHT